MDKNIVYEAGGTEEKLKLCKNGHLLWKSADGNKITGCTKEGCEYSIDAIEKLWREKKGFPMAKEIPQQIVVNSSPPRIELSTNAKGQHQWTISKYGDDLEAIRKEILAIDDLLMEKYKAERGSQ